MKSTKDRRPMSKAGEDIFNMRLICERYAKCNTDIYVYFIDYEKEFDRVNHDKFDDKLSERHKFKWERHEANH